MIFLCLRVSYKKKYEKNNFIFILKVTEERTKEWDSELDPDPDPLVRGTDLRIRIRTKMSRIPNTGYIVPQ
jgi:hypothetical protein